MTADQPLPLYSAASRTDREYSSGGYGLPDRVNEFRVDVPVVETVPKWPFARYGTPDFKETETRPCQWSEIKAGDRAWLGDQPVLIWSVSIGGVVEFMLDPDSDFGGEFHSTDSNWYGCQEHTLTFNADPDSISPLRKALRLHP